MIGRNRYLGLPALLWALGMLPPGAAAPVPRESPELKFRDAAENQILLSSFKGKVVLIEFLLVNCPHCARVAETINQLHRDLGPRGFQPIGIAFENGISAPLVATFAQDFKINYPVGYTSSDKVDGYLGRVGMERFRVPQIVVVDRHGVIRAQSQPIGEISLEDEAYLRKLIDALLREGAVSWTSRISGASPVAILLILGSIIAWKMKHKRQRILAGALITGLLAPITFTQEDARKAHTFHGKVEKVDRKAARLTVNGEEVEGWMVAMTMAYPVDNPDLLKTIKVGDRIEATVYDRDLSLHNIKIVPQASKPK